MRVLVVADVKGWVFDRYAHALMWYSRHCIEVVYGRECHYRFDHTHYDVILWLVDVRPDKLRRLGIPREKVVYAVRSDVYKCKRHVVFGDRSKLGSLAATVLSPNQWLHTRLSAIHPNVVFAPGGVDTRIFNAVPRPFDWPPVVGWAGSIGYFGPRLKGFTEAEEVCRRLGYRWHPAVKEDYHRSLDEMVVYYKEIDVYIDLCLSAGRQNGLLEAMACGRLVFATPVGVAPQLIQHGRNGFLVTAHESVDDTLRKHAHYQREVQEEARTTVRSYWSWEHQAKILDDVFERTQA